jgi:hypothetical protein
MQWGLRRLNIIDTRDPDLRFAKSQKVTSDSENDTGQSRGTIPKDLESRSF